MASLPGTFGPYDIIAGDRARSVRLPQNTQYVQFAVDGVYWVRVRLDAATNLLASDAHYVIPPRSIQTVPAPKGMDHIQAISYMADPDMRVAPNPDDIESEMLITASDSPIPVPVAYAVGLQDSPAAKVSTMATLESLGSPLGTDIIRANGPGDAALRARMTNAGDLYLGDGTSPPVQVLGATDFAGLSVKGYVDRRGQGFGVYATANRMIASGNTIKMQWDASDWNDNGWFDFSTNRFKPLTAGRYQFNVHLRQLALSAGAAWEAWIYKNGVERKKLWNLTGSGADIEQSGTVTDVANGVSDYFEVWLHSGDSVDRTLGVGGVLQWWQGQYVGG